MSAELLSAICHADQMDATIRDISLGAPDQTEAVLEYAQLFLAVAQEGDDGDGVTIEMSRNDAAVLFTVLADAHARMRLKQLQPEAPDDALPWDDEV